MGLEGQNQPGDAADEIDEDEMNDEDMCENATVTSLMRIFSLLSAFVLKIWLFLGSLCAGDGHTFVLSCGSISVWHAAINALYI